MDLQFRPEFWLLNLKIKQDSQLHLIAGHESQLSQKRGMSSNEWFRNCTCRESQMSGSKVGVPVAVKPETDYLYFSYIVFRLRHTIQYLNDARGVYVSVPRTLALNRERILRADLERIAQFAHRVSERSVATLYLLCGARYHQLIFNK